MKLSYSQLDDFVGVLLKRLHEPPFDLRLPFRLWFFRLVERDPDDPIITILLERRSHDDRGRFTGRLFGGMSLDMSEWDDENGFSLVKLISTKLLEARAQIDHEAEAQSDSGHAMKRVMEGVSR